jgi:hypothetical protein
VAALHGVERRTTSPPSARRSHKRGADAAVVGVQLALEASPYNGVAAEARQLRQAVHQMARSGEQRDGVAVANTASIGELAALLDK